MIVNHVKYDVFNIPYYQYNSNTKEKEKQSVSVMFIERFVHFNFRLRFQEPMSLFLTVGRLD